MLEKSNATSESFGVLFCTGAATTKIRLKFRMTKSEKRSMFNTAQLVSGACSMRVAELFFLSPRQWRAQRWLLALGLALSGKLGRPSCSIVGALCRHQGLTFPSSRPPTAAAEVRR
jgi:hypothetical protein